MVGAVEEPAVSHSNFLFITYTQSHIRTHKSTHLIKLHVYALYTYYVHIQCI